MIAQGDLNSDPHLAYGKDSAGNFVTGFPASLTIDGVFMARGRERFEIYCGPCHGALGDGRGIVSQYGWGGPINLHDDRIRNMAEGEIYNTITHGKNTMFGYAEKLTIPDRWAVIAYLRALERSQNGSINDVPASHKAELN